jgi:nitroreductase
MPVSQCQPIKKDLQISAVQVEQLIKSRRSIRAYQDKPVPRDTLIHLIEVARYAPTGHNTQTVQWLVIDNKEVLQRFTDIGNDWLRWRIKSKSGPFRFPNELEWFEVMLKRYEKGENEFLRDPPSLIVTHSQKDDHAATASSTIALAYLDLAANTLGLGCCWLGLFNMVASTYPPMIRALGLPEGHKPYGSMTVGYPKYKYQRIPTRKVPPITWHP